MSNSAAQKQRRAQRARAFLDELIKRYPNALSADPKAVRPLAIGTLEALSGDLAKDPEWANSPKWLIRQALAVYTRRPSYLRALAGGGHRVHLDGTEADPVSEEAKAHAQQTLDARKPAKPAPKRKSPPRHKGRRKQTGVASDSKLEALQRKFNN
ncbi:ProQ/FinO family protein [Ectothiorhodospiraceae bacterium WFHF3C12]|nr:ProQ/FinO family protein [Ectothiorhodospiraceae bacterium WFHF3C12]